MVTALAFAHFARCHVHAVVLEAGLGGARDATNVVPAARTALAAVTNVGAEHLEALGGSLAGVAAAKVRAWLRVTGGGVGVGRRGQGARTALNLVPDGRTVLWVAVTRVGASK